MIVYILGLEQMYKYVHTTQLLLEMFLLMLCQQLMNKIDSY